MSLENATLIGHLYLTVRFAERLILYYSVASFCTYIAVNLCTFYNYIFTLDGMLHSIHITVVNHAIGPHLQAYKTEPIRPWHHPLDIRPSSQRHFTFKASPNDYDGRSMNHSDSGASGAHDVPTCT